MLRKRISCAPCSHLLKINFFVAACEAVFLLTYAKYAARWLFFLCLVKSLFIQFFPTFWVAVCEVTVSTFALANGMNGTNGANVSFLFPIGLIGRIGLIGSITMHFLILAKSKIDYYLCRKKPN